MLVMRLFAESFLEMIHAEVPAAIKTNVKSLEGYAACRANSVIQGISLSSHRSITSRVMTVARLATSAIVKVTIVVDPHKAQISPLFSMSTAPNQRSN